MLTMIIVDRDIKADVLLASISGGTDIIACFMGENSTLPVYRGEIQVPAFAAHQGHDHDQMIMMIILIMMRGTVQNQPE